jgi:hypothetical protein
VAGFVSFKGIAQRSGEDSYRFRDQLVLPSTLEIPVLAVLGDNDAEPIADGVFRVMADIQELDTRWTLVFELNGRHNAVGTTHEITIPFIEEVIDLRIPEDADPTAGPVQLNPLPLESGWLGILEHHRVYEDEESKGEEIIDNVAIAPYSDDVGDTEKYWLISERFAQQWLAYQTAE